MESPCGESLQLDDKSVPLHEMDTQIIKLNDEEETSPTLCEDVSVSSSTPLLEGRRTRSGKSLEGTGERIVKVKKERRVKPKSKIFIPKRGPYYRPQGQKFVPKKTDLKVDSVSTDISRSEKLDDSTKGRDSVHSKSVDDDEYTTPNVPLADFMANFNASPTSSSRVEINKPVVSNVSFPNSEQELSKSTVEDPKSVKGSIESEKTVGQLRSAPVDIEALRLARGFKKSLRDTEEFALNFISQEFHHPVITCFRELTSTDVSLIVRSNKLKKSCNGLEQSIIYLGLIDLLATVNNNPVYGETETSKLSKNLSTTIKKVLLEFKNLLGSWALSCNEQLSNRYTLILNYLRTLVPMFKKAGFDQELGNILDCIEKEVNRHKSNQEKIKSMGSSLRGTENSNDKKPSASLTDSQDGESRSALNEIILNVDLNVKNDESDDEEGVTVLKKEASLEIFGKPLKGSPHSTDLSKKKIKKVKTKLDLINNDESLKSPTSTTQKKRSNETPKSQLASKKSSLPQPKTLSNAFLSSPRVTATTTENSTGKTTALKRMANDDLNTTHGTTKKRKIEDESSAHKVKCNEEKLSIKNFFQSVTSPTSSSAKSHSATQNFEKPAVNAFAIMMNKSREIALKKKTDKMNAVTVPSLKVNAVKS